MVTAIKILAKMKGSSDSHLIEASNGRLYVTKHSQGPCRERLLVNEIFAAALARRIGLPVPVVLPIVVPASLVQEGSGSHLGPPWTPGLHCGSEFVADLRLPAYDWFPRSRMPKVLNLEAVAGCWIFDVWSGNTDQTQVVFYRPWRARKFRFAKIDHGWCFGAGDWIPRDLRREILGWQKPVFEGKAFAISLFSPYVERIQRLSRDEIAACAETVPTEWLTKGQEQADLERLGSLLARRAARLDEHARVCWPAVSYHSAASVGAE